MTGAYDGDDETSQPLVGNGRNHRINNRRDTARSSILINRMFVIGLLVLLVGVSLFFESSQTQLSQQLETDEEKIGLLTQTLQAQAQVIQRFNESVTNSDVLQRLQALENNLEQSKLDLYNQLDETITDVGNKLNQTLINLDDTVENAQREIKEEVQSVKKNFDQYVVKTQDQFSMENSFMVYQLAGTFTLLSCLISMWHMTAHLRKLKQPVIQRKILAILWMSPIYAITSWFSLVFHGAEGYLAIIKDGYEAYIIYQFLSFCISVLGKGDRQTVVNLLARRANHLTPPFRLFFCCRPDPYESDKDLADAILLQCQFFAMQFVFFRPVTTIAKVVLDKYDYCGPWTDQKNDWKAFQFYVVLIQNLSIFIAFAGLLKFYHAVDKDLGWCRPFAKFLCIKGVVFMTFWQGLAITILAETTDVGGGDAEEWAMSAQNFLICLEMLLFSIAHFYCFPTDEWEENYKTNYNKSKFGDSIALGDFFADLKLLVKGNRKKRRKKKRSKQPSEPTVPEGDEDDNAEEGDAGIPHTDSNSELENIDDDQSDEQVDDSTETSDIEEAEAAIADALVDTDAESSNADVEEARQRVLASSFLSEMLLFSQPQSNRDTSDASYGTHSQHSRNEADLYAGSESAYSGEETATEETGLLAAQSPLRPSIFTTVGDIVEQEKESSR